MKLIHEVGVPENCMTNPFFRPLGLAIKPEQYVNKKLFVKPVYGWGWTSVDSRLEPHLNEVNGAPCPFYIRVEDFVRHRGRLTGGLGRIVEKGHAFFDLSICFELRSEGTWNFTNQVGYHNLYLGHETQDVLPSNEVQAGWSYPIIGYGFIAESCDDIEKCESREREKWEIMRDAIFGSKE